MTENYLSIQQLLYNNKFNYRIEVDEIPDPEAILLPPMLTQPFIENAIKHGLKRRESGGFVQIRFYKKGEALFFEVTDNGSGIEAKESAGAHKSMSLNYRPGFPQSPVKAIAYIPYPHAPRSVSTRLLPENNAGAA